MADGRGAGTPWPLWRLPVFAERRLSLEGTVWSDWASAHLYGTLDDFTRHPQACCPQGSCSPASQIPSPPGEEHAWLGQGPPGPRGAEIPKCGGPSNDVVVPSIPILLSRGQTVPRRTQLDPELPRVIRNRGIKCRWTGCNHNFCSRRHPLHDRLVVRLAFSFTLPSCTSGLRAVLSILASVPYVPSCRPLHSRSELACYRAVGLVQPRLLPRLCSVSPRSLNLGPNGEGRASGLVRT